MHRLIFEMFLDLLGSSFFENKCVMQISQNWELSMCGRFGSTFAATGSFAPLQVRPLWVRYRNDEERLIFGTSQRKTNCI